MLIGVVMAKFDEPAAKERAAMPSSAPVDATIREKGIKITRDNLEKTVSPPASPASRGSTSGEKRRKKKSARRGGAPRKKKRDKWQRVRRGARCVEPQTQTQSQPKPKPNPNPPRAQSCRRFLARALLRVACLAAACSQTHLPSRISLAATL